MFVLLTQQTVPTAVPAEILPYLGTLVHFQQACGDQQPCPLPEISAEAFASILDYYCHYVLDPRSSPHPDHKARTLRNWESIYVLDLFEAPGPRGAHLAAVITGANYLQGQELLDCLVDYAVDLLHQASSSTEISSHFDLTSSSTN